MYIKNVMALKAMAVYVLLGFSSFPGGAQAQENDPALTPKQVVAELINAMEANDAEEIRSLFSANATQEYERFWARKKQGADFREWLESDIISVHGRVTNPEIEANGKQVVVTGTYTNADNYSSPANFLLIVEDDKITGWTMRYD